MKEILQTLKAILILILYPLYFIRYTYDCFNNRGWYIHYYLEQSWYKMIFLIDLSLLFSARSICKGDFSPNFKELEFRALIL